MLNRLFTFVLTSFILSSCATRNLAVDDQFHYHDDGLAKPRVAFIPVLDTSNSDSPWSLSEKLTEDIETRLYKSGKLFLSGDYHMLGKDRSHLLELNPFSDEIDWVREMDSQAEFIVFIELSEHNLVANSPGKKLFNLQLPRSYSLDISIRVKVIDLREKDPNVILQEILHKSFYIPWKFSSIDYKQSGWSRAAFNLSPIGLAHSQIVRKITNHIQDYILLAKTK